MPKLLRGETDKKQKQYATEKNKYKFFHDTVYVRQEEYMSTLEHLYPERVFYYFKQIAAIPHGSGNTKAISDYLVKFAKEHALTWYQDEANNVVLVKEASKGYEKAPAIIIQGHMDMVCEKKKTVILTWIKKDCACM